MRASRQEGGVGWSVAQAAGKPRTVEAEDRARAEHTPNIPPMAVTRDVSKLSGWLNARAYCRESKGRHSMRTIRRARRRKDAGTVAYN